MSEYYGSAEAKRVLKAIETHKIQVPSIEMFLFDYNDVSDPSLLLYNTCKSVEEFITQSIINFKKRAEMGETNIIIQEFFLIITDLLKSDNSTSVTIKELFRTFITALITATNQSPYNIVIIEPTWAKEISKNLGLEIKGYENNLLLFFSVFEEIFNSIKNIKGYLPSVKVVYPVYHDTRENQLSYLINKFRMSDKPKFVANTLKDIPSLSKDTPLLRSTLEYLRSHANLPFINIDSIILELQELENSTYLKRYPSRNSLKRVFNTYATMKNYYNNLKMEPTFANKETFEKCFIPYFCDVHIDCSKIKKENLESFIDVAKIINLTKGYYAKNKRDINSLTFKITLNNVKEVNKEFTDFIENKLKRINSATNKNFILDIFYDQDIVNRRIPEDIITHFRVISDIHADYNKENNYLFNFGDDFVLNCGDTAGNSIEAAHWINNYMKKGTFIIGNHLGYSSSHPDRDGIQNMKRYSNTRHPSSTKREQIKELYNLTDKKDVVLLSNTCTEFKGIIIIGTCLYTDFDLYGKDHREECMNYAKQQINDFRLPVVMDNQYYIQDEEGRWLFRTRKVAESCIRPFAPSDHAYYFQFSFEYIKKAVEENKHKPIVITTHHAPTPYAIDEKYKGSFLNAAFASNLNKYIIEHPEIRMWCFGHVHNPCDFILGETRMVCCPFGYNNENNFNLPYEYGLRVPISDIKSKKSWRKILSRDIALGRVQVYNE